jgi:hypothetical protein
VGSEGDDSDPGDAEELTKHTEKDSKELFPNSYVSPIYED